MTIYCPDCGRQINSASGCSWCAIGKDLKPVQKTPMPKKQMQSEWMLKPYECHKACHQCEGCQAFCDVGKVAQVKLLQYLIEQYQQFIDMSPFQQQSVNRMIGQLEAMLKQIQGEVE